MLELELEKEKLRLLDEIAKELKKINLYVQLLLKEEYRIEME